MTDDADEIARVSRQVAARLGALGIALDGRETPEELANVEDAVAAYLVRFSRATDEVRRHSRRR
ncbi:MAG: hypothetical protein ACRELE_06660 [Gemmatimonadales bacterium]